MDTLYTDIEQMIVVNTHLARVGIKRPTAALTVRVTTHWNKTKITSFNGDLDQENTQRHDVPTI